MLVDRAGQDKSQEGVAVVAVVDMRADPVTDSVDEEVVLVVGRVKVPGASFAPCPDSTRLSAG